MISGFLSFIFLYKSLNFRDQLLYIFRISTFRKCPYIAILINKDDFATVIKSSRD